MNENPTVLSGSCHCGTVQFEFDHEGGTDAAGLEKLAIKRCNCSLCKRKGTMMLTTRVGEFRIKRGAEALSLYQWNHDIARHYFCSHCGIYTHHQRRSNPLEIGVNVGCVDEIDVAECGVVVMGDGVGMSLVG